MAARPDRLREYDRKRDFRATREPRGANRRRGGSEPIFVIQKHAARRLHWDLRLQVGGALASWAVPKEPPAKPAIRRLAVKVEDHPLEYADFEGTIPAGQYGAGTVEIWDRGTYSTPGDPEKAIEEGKIEFELHGERLQGAYVLVRMDSEKGDEWLLLKQKSEKSFEQNSPAIRPGRIPGPKARRLPDFVRPNLCTPVDELPAGEDWLHEIKWDGYRLLVRCEGTDVRCYSRNGNRVALPELEADLAGWASGTWLDGELVGFDENGITEFNLVQNALGSRHTERLVLCAFDLPFYQGHDLRREPLTRRKELLEAALGELDTTRVRFSTHVQADGNELFQKACAQGLEGVISKRADSAYAERRTKTWLKRRCEKIVEARIVGYTQMANGSSAIGALLLAIQGEDGELVYAGKVGTGFSDSMRRDLFRTLADSRIESPPLAGRPKGLPRAAQWVAPDRTARVKFLEWTAAGTMRQPKLVGLEPAARGSRPAPQGTRATGSEPELPVKITNPDRVVDPETGATKLDLARYYAAVAPRLLPYLEGRPIATLRCPEGLRAVCFFQKHWMPGLSPAVDKVQVDAEADGEPYVAIHDAEGLLSLIQMGAIELHPWGSRTRDLERPDVLVFDLDPGEGVGRERRSEGARIVRSALEGLDLPTFAKVTGGKGVHVVVPIRPELEWPEAKEFCERFAKLVAEHHPELFTANMAKSKRKGKIFLDYLRNGRGATAICPYGVRARSGLPVAMPIYWDELDGVQPDAFRLADAAARALRADDPWAGFWENPGSLREALGRSG